MALGALAGCSKADAPGRPDGNPQDTTPSGTASPEVTPEYPSPEQGTDLVSKFDPERTDASVTVGGKPDDSEPSRSHSLLVWNAGTETRALSIQVTDRRDGTTVIDDTCEVSADGSVTVSFVEPSTYVVDVWLPATGTGASVTVGPGLIDCNASSTYVRVDGDGGFTATTFSTAVACPSDLDRA